MKLKIFLVSVCMLFLSRTLPSYEIEFENCYDCNTYCPSAFNGTFAVGGDWLYWKTDQTELIYGAEVQNVAENTIRAKTLSPHFKYHNGWRVFGEYTTCDKIWNFRIAYTHAPSSGHNHFNSNSKLGVNFGTIFNMNFPIYTVLALTEFNSLNANWSSTVNFLDAIASRSFDVCDTLCIAPYVGVRGLWIKQTFRLSGLSTSEDLDLSFDSKLSGRLSGIGLVGGLKGSWEIFNGLSLIGDIGGSVHYTWNRNKGSLFAFANEDELNIGYKNNGNSRGIPMFDAFVGLQYANNCGGYGFNVHVGWEEHLIFDTSDFSLTSTGNTTLQGLTLGAAVSF